MKDYPLGGRDLHDLDRPKARLDRAVEADEIPVSVDVHALTRFVQAVQNGMSILARNGISHAELESVAQAAMLGWDARTARYADIPRKGGRARAPKNRTQKSGGFEALTTGDMTDSWASEQVLT